MAGADGDWIRRLRRRLGVTQKELGQLLDVGGNEIGYYESSKRRPSKARRRLLLAALNAIDHWPTHLVYPRPQDDKGRPVDLTINERLMIIFKLACRQPPPAAHP